LLEKLAQFFTEYFISIGKLVFLGLRMLCVLFKLKLNDVLLEIFNIGTKSLLLIMIAAWFVGMVLSLQINSVLHAYGSDAFTGAVVALALVKELGAVLCAFLFIARVGMGITSQISIMKLTDQLTAMKLMNIDPLNKVYAPKFWATVISMPVLTNFFNSIAILASYFVCKFVLHNNVEFFFWHISQKIDLYMFLVSLIKSIVFSIIISLVCIYQGVFYKENTFGIVRANARAVFVAVVMVMVSDFIITTLALK
jgi:phospholipid/cholesterol/gamma-HCH transport system permease protein